MTANIAELRRLEAEATDRSAHPITRMHAREEIVRALPELLKALEWQPIETAPKDGTEIFGWRKEAGVSQMIFFDGEWQCVDWCWDNFINCTWHPTHWIPLPLPPHGGVDVG